MALITLDGLLACLEMRPVADEPGRWEAVSLDMDYHRIFGGQLLAQAVVLGAATTPGKRVKALHVVFPREGSADEPLRFTVESSHDGRSFATRRIDAHQDGKPIFLSTATLHIADEGPEHHDPAPDVGTPADAQPADMTMIPWETRVVGGVDLGDRAVGPSEFAFWTRVADRRLSDDPTVHQALLAHATDLTVIGTALRPHEGLSQADAQVRLHTAVTAHSVWFHRPFRFDDWCLVHQTAPIAAGARAFGVGHVHDVTGALVATFTQESLIRPLAED